ncbi:MAG: CpaF family protein [Candidatus Latescibacterota bacterium]|nr:MAG: CpaF family protein [Candidatus Latescibacterota bacterium]
MSLRERFRSGGSRSEQPERDESRGKAKPANPSGDGNGKGNGRSAAGALNDRSSGLKARIHRRMVERINLANLDSIEPEMLRAQIGHIINALVTEENIPLSEPQRVALEQEVLNETFGLGPIEPLLHDPDVSDILVNTHNQVYIERFGQLELTDVRFDDDAHLMKMIDRIVSRIGRRVDESSPMVDARLQDGSRVNAIIPPLALDGPILSIRRFGVRTLALGDLLELDSISPGMAELLKGAVRARLNMLISGGTGSGKTTLLNALSAFIPAEERIVTIEDAAELQLLQPHIVRLETRPPNIEGKGEITQRELVRNALRMRPDRIVVGEVRGHEVLDMLQAMNTGHDGSLTTVHANNPRDALHRLETLMLLSGVNLPPTAMREQISAALDVIVHVARLSDGTRRVVEVSEIVGMEREVVAMQEIFTFKKTGVSEDGKVLGRYEATGIRPKFADRLEVSGVSVSASLFHEGQVI